MMAVCKQTESKIRIVHELPRRLRIRTPVLHDPAFDTVYLEAMLLNLPGIEAARFNLKAACITLNYDGSAQTRQRILVLLENIPAETFQQEMETETPEDPYGLAFHGISAMLTPLMPRYFKAPLSWFLGMPTIAQGVVTLLTQGIKIEALDAAAVGFSLLRRDYFTANIIVFLLKLGQYLKQLSEEKSDALLRSLLCPRSEEVWVEREGLEVRVSFGQVIVGDVVICGTGEMIPVDGIVLDGEASVNQSSITGESLPVHLQTGDKAVSGSLIVEGRIKIRAGRVGQETTTARISRFLENSLRFRSKTQQQSDRLADKLVPVTFGLGIAAWMLTHDIRRAASVLTVDYSCAVKLADPVAVKMTMYRAAHAGVLIKGSHALDALSRVDTLVFDKTGTLTRGLLTVTDVLPVNNMSKDRLLALAAAAEEHYAHPLAKAVVRAAKERNLKMPSLSQVDFIVAHGVSAYVEGERILVGSRHFIAEDEGINCSAADVAASAIRSQGKSLLYVAKGDILAGVIGLQDELRAEVPDVLHRLKTQGIRKIIVLTGDHRDTARAVTAGLEDIDEVRWELKPEDKSDIIRELREAGHIPAFVGDGVNDAPALVTADVGICMPAGADLARESAAVVLLKDDLNALSIAKESADRCRDIIKNCFGAAVGFNSLLLFLAMRGLLPPAVSAVLHNANTVGILGYAALAGKKFPASSDSDKGENKCTSHP
jgi:Cu2+-exporting ATPase